MADGDDDGPTERPATWENEVVGEVKELLGRAIGDEELAEGGKDQTAIAREVHEEYEEKRGHAPHDSQE